MEDGIRVFCGEGKIVKQRVFASHGGRHPSCLRRRWEDRETASVCQDVLVVAGYQAIVCIFYVRFLRFFASMHTTVLAAFSMICPVYHQA